MRIDRFEVKAKLEGDMLFCCNRDVPGVVGWIGSLLAEEELNIADMALGRDNRGGQAIMVISLDFAGIGCRAEPYCGVAPVSVGKEGEVLENEAA